MIIIVNKSKENIKFLTHLLSSPLDIKVNAMVTVNKFIIIDKFTIVFCNDSFMQK